MTSAMGFIARFGSALFAFAEANLMYISSDPPAEWVRIGVNKPESVCMEMRFVPFSLG